MLLPSVAIMSGQHGPVVNLYEPGRASTAQADLAIKSAYPFDSSVDITVTPKQSDPFTIALRIPAWSDQTTLTVNGAPIRDLHPGSYATIERRWKPGDRIHLVLDLSPRLKRRDNFTAITKGPLVLARDLRLGDANIDAPTTLDAPLKSVPPPPGVAAAYTTPSGIHLCDYASAGNTWDATSRYRVWIPS
jgi:hypothetical protein